MAYTASLVFLAFTFLIINFPLLANAIGCNGPCRTLNDCDGQLICINGRCNDDRDVGTHICGGGMPPNPPPSGGSCQSSGTLNCGGKSYPQYRCSPPVTSSTPAILTLNDFSEGGDGGDPSQCDEKFHNNTERVVALSTGWFNGSSLCLKMIRITAGNGRNVTAKVVDQCDSVNGCDRAHAGQPPCRNNIVDGSQAVWDALGLDSDVGEARVTWSMA